MSKPENDMPLVAAAMALGLGYHGTLNAILRGDLEGWQDDRGRWRVARASVEARRLLKSERSAETQLKEQKRI
jgi:hypothetical protein